MVLALVHTVVVVVALAPYSCCNRIQPSIDYYHRYLLGTNHAAAAAAAAVAAAGAWQGALVSVLVVALLMMLLLLQLLPHYPYHSSLVAA